MYRSLSLLLVLSSAFLAHAHDANRLAYLDDPNPFYPSRDFPKLTTPQWIGEPSVDAAIILSIDDMRDPKKYEAYLRPIIDKLKSLYGTASMSIMACNVDPKDPHLQTWLDEGLSIEIHTVAHPCPLLGRGQFAEARATVESCVSLMANIPGNAPVAFRMPCCDSINSTSPRFFYEIFDNPSPGVPRLSIDSSVFNITTANDPALPREWILREDGRERFRTYLPFPSFKTTIEDYPYPYIIGGNIWEFPCAVPSDWEAQNINKPNHPQSLADMKTALDAAVAKKGVYTLVFHPHGWIENTQIVELIEHASTTYGGRVRFLSFRDAQDRLSKLFPNDARGPVVFDADGDGVIDAVAPPPATEGAAIRYGIDVDGAAMAIALSSDARAAWRFVDGAWVSAPKLAEGLQLGGARVVAASEGRDRGVRIRDIDGDGAPELLALGPEERAVFTRTAVDKKWKKLSFAPPADAAIVDSEGRDNGLRLVDVDGDLDLDILVSNQDYYALYLFDSMETGWSTTAVSGVREGTDPAAAIPAIAVNGENNGAWFHSRSLWVQNERTDKMPDLVDRRSFNDLTATVEPKPKSPEAALASMSVRPGLRVELVAAEPLVVDPIAIAWGADGKLWVVEMRDYPLGMDGEGKPGSRVKFLEDLDGDGKYDKATVFLDKLNFATGVMPWRDGVLVTAAPLVFFAKDTNGDGKADDQETLFDGFVQGNQQHRVNGLRWGLDNWVHCANGDSGGEITSAKSGESSNISHRDFRIRPDDGALDPESGNSQYGICFDDWGSRFGCANWLPVWHYALDDRYLRRNPHFAPGNPREYIVRPEKLYPTSRTLARFNDFEYANKATSTCGIDIYRDTLLGPEYYGNSFVCEPVHNLVLRTVLEPNGATFSGHRAPGEEQAEVLSSHDNWFRPVQARTGPDGALYVVDMYRQVIEHPEYISEETQATLDLRAGDDKGRIYRVVPVHGKLRPVPRLDSLATADLVAQLESPNGALRDMTHQLIFERADPAAVTPLRALAQSESPQARLHALRALDGLGALTRDDVLKALKDEAPGVRRNAAQLAAAHVNDWPGVGPALVALRNDVDPFVHMELVYALGEWKDPAATRALGEFIENDRRDSYFSMALLSSLDAAAVRTLAPWLLAWAASGDASTEARDQVISASVGIAIAANDAETLTLMASTITNSELKRYASEQFLWLAEFLDALKSRGASLDALGTGAVADAARGAASRMFGAARALAQDTAALENARVGAARLLGKDPAQTDTDAALLAHLLAPPNPDSVRAAALESLIATESAAAPGALLAAWSGLGEDARGTVLDAMMQRDAWTAALMTALENGAPGFREIDATHRQQLLNNDNDDVRVRAEKLMASAANPDRQAVIEQYKDAATIAGQFLRGRGIFRERCASCHKMGEIGHAVGPDLTAITDRKPESVLTSILDPNRAVETKFFDYTIETNDLMTYNGILVEESGNSVTIRGANGAENKILRSTIESMTTKSRSPMPDGLEDGLTPEDLANLLAFILETGPRE